MLRLVNKIVDFFVAKKVQSKYYLGWKKLNPLTPWQVIEKHYLKKQYEDA